MIGRGSFYKDDTPTALKRRGHFSHLNIWPFNTFQRVKGKPETIGNYLDALPMSQHRQSAM